MVENPLKNLIGWAVSMVIVSIVIHLTQSVTAMYATMLIIAVVWFCGIDPPERY